MLRGEGWKTWIIQRALIPINLLQFLVFSKDCKYPELVGDGYCHDLTNNAECNYDGGDCCVLEQNIITDHCSECVCHVQETCASDGGHPLAGDGFCNDETNIEGCMFDGLDCCGIVDDYFDYTRDPITTFCEECVCYGTVHTSLEISLSAKKILRYMVLSWTMHKV